MSSILDELKNKYPDTEGVQKANNIAEGVAAMPTGGSGSEPLIINATENTEHGVIYVLDKTWQEIHDAFTLGRPCIINHEYDYGEVSGMTLERVSYVMADSETGYTVGALAAGSYTSETDDGYPSVVIEEPEPQPAN